MWTLGFESETPPHRETAKKPSTVAYQMEVVFQVGRHIIEGIQLSALAASVFSVNVLENLDLDFLKVFQLRIEALGYEPLFLLSTIMLLSCPFFYFGSMLLLGECCGEGLDVVLGTLGKLVKPTANAI